jgi:hypothetical protein
VEQSEIDKRYRRAAAEQYVKVLAAFKAMDEALKLPNNDEVGRLTLRYNEEVNTSNELRGDWNEASGRTRFGMNKSGSG